MLPHRSLGRLPRVSFDTSANTCQYLPRNHKRDTKKSAHPAGTAQSNRQALRKLSRSGITDISIDPISLAPLKKKKKKKTKWAGSPPGCTLPLNWRLAITKGAPDMGIDLGASLDDGNGFGGGFDGGFDDLDVGFDDVGFDDAGEDADQNVQSSSFSSSPFPPPPPPPPPLPPSSPSSSSSSSSSSTAAAEVHQDEECSPASPPFLIEDQTDALVGGEASRGAHDIGEYGASEASNIMVLLPSAQVEKVPVLADSAEKATPETIAPPPKSKAAAASATTTTTIALSESRSEVPPRTTSTRIRALSTSSFRQGNRKKCRTPCSLGGLRKVKGYVFAPPLTKASSP
jgi:hypothetical protein